MKFNTEKVLGISAIFVSFATLIALIYQSRLMREHEESSALPKLELWNNDPDDAYLLVLVNKGVGPAIIENISISFDDSLYNMDQANFAALYLDSVRNDTKEFLYRYSNVYPGMIISAGSSVELLQVRKDSVKEENPLIKLFGGNKAKVILLYASVYQKVWKLDGLGQIPNLIPDYEAESANKILGKN